MSLAERHYSRSDVQDEIIDFCRGRWVAAHYRGLGGDLIFRRYVHGRPLRIDTADSFSEILELNGYSLRSIYASANVYWGIKSIEDVYDLSNIRFCSPVWDIDGELENWRLTLRVAEEIVSFLNKWGVEESLFLKWSGNGCHVHIHEGAFSDGLLRKHHPLDLAYAIVEFVNSRLHNRLLEILVRGRIKIENRVDPARVFTCPLSLHRELDVVCICFRQNEISKFNPGWIEPPGFHHDPSWRDHVRGEADDLAVEALNAVGGYPLKRRRRRRKTIPLDKQIIKWLRKD